MTAQTRHVSQNATELLSGRLLVQSSSRWSEEALDNARSPMGGLVLTGPTAGIHVRKIHSAHPDLVLGYDPETYREVIATRDEPFHLPAKGIFGSVDLRQVLDEQRSMGASFSLTPTGHLEFDDSIALKSAIVRTAKLDRSDTVVHLPLDARWLKPSHISSVLEAIENSTHPVALSLAHNQDPSSIAGVAEGLQRIARLPTPVLLLRTDLAGLDFLARGGLASTVGATSTLRHGIAPHLRGRKINVADRRSNLLWQPLLHYIRPSRIEDLFANAPEPTCDCGACRGKPLNRFHMATISQEEAKTHNLVTLREIFDVFRQERGDRRRALWCAEVRIAIANHEAIALSLGQRSFRAPKPLTHWAF